MKKITIVTAIASVLAIAPLMVGCGAETADEVTEPGNEADEEEAAEDAELDSTGGEEEPEGDE